MDVRGCPALQGGDCTEDVDVEAKRAERRGRRYVKRSFKRRRERIREEWLARMGRIIEDFKEYLRGYFGDCGEDRGD